MNRHVFRPSALVVVFLTLPLLSLGAKAQLAVSSNDNKLVLVNGVPTVTASPADDTVTIIDLGASPPKVLGELKAPSSVVGPPQNVAIAPDESIALVASSMKLDPSDPKKLTPDNRLSVIDLKANPPAVIATIETGLGPSGISINRAGTLALVANANDGTVSIFTLSGKTLAGAGKIQLDNPKSLPRSVAFSPDGKMALVSRYGDHKISILSVEGNKVEDTKRVMTGGFQPYAIQVSSKGDVAVVGNQGGNTGDIDTINVIDLKGKIPRIVHTLDVGQIVEGLGISKDGNYVALTAQDGSARPPDHPFYNANSLVAVFEINGTNLTKVAEAKIGKWSQGVAWSRDGKTLLAQSMFDKSLSVLSFDGKQLKITGEIKVSGGPEGLRTAEY
jgi:DNA-binding beta-propeller fold protein YncE